MTDLAEIKVMSLANFNNLSSTDDSKLYFVEEDSSGGGAITEYSSGKSGYIIFPSGMCIQWGEVSASSTTQNVSLTKTYADTNYAVFATCTNSSVSSVRYIMTVYAYSTSKISVMNSSGVTAKWLTIGQLASGQY